MGEGRAGGIVMNNTATYGLLDSGLGRKLEQVGPYRLVRPASQALWSPSRPTALWETADACYQRGPSGAGNWRIKRHDLPATWTLTYCGLALRIKLTDFGHLGFFAEHGPHWEWLREQIAVVRRPVKVLNAFAYTGSSTLAAAAGGAQVVHLDGAEGIVTWAQENAQLAGLAGAPIRWIVEDVTKFLSREIRRGNRYDVIILDPPSFGRGPKGEVWKLTRDLPPLLGLCRQLLSESPLAVVLSAHTPGITPLVLENILADIMALDRSQLCSMELQIPQVGSPRGLPSGALVRWRNDVY